MKIALLSDTHLADIASDFVANITAAIGWINKASPDLVIVLGDLSADGVVAPEHMYTARDVLAKIKAPVKYLPGNHDIGDNPNVGDRHRHEPVVQAQALNLYRELFGPDYWSFTASGWTLLGLNAQLFGMQNDEEDKQWQWIEQTLSVSDGPLGLMLHKPLFRSHPFDGDEHHRYVPLKARHRLLNLVQHHDLRFVISGHTHQARNLVHAGTEHIWTPSTAFIIPDYLQERIGDKVVGMLVLELSPQSYRIERLVANNVRQLEVDDYADVYEALKSVVKPMIS